MPRMTGRQALMDVDLRVVAVKLTNRFCEIGRKTERESEKGEHVRVIKVYRSRAEKENGGG